MFLEKPYLPQEIDAVLATFPAHVKHLMPPESDIPGPFRGLIDGSISLSDNRAARQKVRPWLNFQHEWFCGGLTDKTVSFEVHDGIDEATALRHLSAIQRSFEPDHGYKEAAVAYLASLWFKSVSIEEDGHEAG